MNNNIDKDKIVKNASQKTSAKTFPVESMIASSLNRYYGPYVSIGTPEERFSTMKIAFDNTNFRFDDRLSRSGSGVLRSIFDAIVTKQSINDDSRREKMGVPNRSNSVVDIHLIDPVCKIHKELFSSVIKSAKVLVTDHISNPLFDYRSDTSLPYSTGSHSKVRVGNSGLMEDVVQDDFLASGKTFLFLNENDELEDEVSRIIRLVGEGIDGIDENDSSQAMERYKTLNTTIEVCRNMLIQNEMSDIGFSIGDVLWSISRESRFDLYREGTEKHPTTGKTTIGARGMVQYRRNTWEGLLGSLTKSNSSIASMRDDYAKLIPSYFKSFIPISIFPITWEQLTVKKSGVSDQQYVVLNMMYYANTINRWHKKRNDKYPVGWNYGADLLEYYPGHSLYALMEDRYALDHFYSKSKINASGPKVLDFDVLRRIYGDMPVAYKVPLSEDMLNEIIPSNVKSFLDNKVSGESMKRELGNLVIYTHSNNDGPTGSAAFYGLLLNNNVKHEKRISNRADSNYLDSISPLMNSNFLRSLSLAVVNGGSVDTSLTSGVLGVRRRLTDTAEDISDATVRTYGINLFEI